MKKITGKVVSLVLALALVVTSFSATFAFAANQATAVVTPTKTEITLANGNTGSIALTSYLTASVAELYDHTSVLPLTIVEAVRASGADLLSLTTTSGAVTATLKDSANGVGTEVLAVRYTGTQIINSVSTTIYGQANVKVNVLAKGSHVIGGVPATSVIVGVTPADGIVPALTPLAKNAATKEIVGAVYRVDYDTTGLAKYIPEAIAVNAAGAVSGEYVVNAQSANPTTTPAQLGTAFTDDGSTFHAFKVTLANGALDLVPGTVALQSIAYTGASTPATQTALNFANAITTVDNRVVLGTKANIYQWHGITWADSALPIAETAAGNTVSTPTATAINVTGSDVELGALTTTMASGNVGKVITDSSMDFALTSGTVSSVTGDGNFSMAAGTAGSVNTTGTVAISGGQVGAITTTSTATPAVTVNATDEKVPTVVGNITAKNITVKSDKASVKTGAIKENAQTGTITLSGSSTATGAIDFDYYATNLTFDNFVGTIAAPAKSSNGSITTAASLATPVTAATVTGAISVNNVSVNAGTLTIADSLQVQNVSGVGTLVIPAGKLNVKNSMSTVSLKLSDKVFTAGVVVFTADAYKVYEGSFKTIGFTLEKVSGTTTDAFKIKSVDFANIVINKTSSKIVLGQKETFTASAYPTGTSIPAGATIKWTFNGPDDYFTFTSNGNTATVEAKKFESLFTSLNTGTLTATLVDQYGFAMYGYTPATCDVTIIEKPETTYKSDTTSNVAVSTKYTFKITSLNGKAPTMASGNTKVFTTALTKTVGSDYYFTITAVGKVGESAGIYVNGEARLVVATVKANFKSDTTSNITVKGAYTYAITAAATPTFAVGTPSAFTAAFVSKTGDKYLYKITAVGKTGTAAGIYVNGVKVNVATVG